MDAEAFVTAVVGPKFLNVFFMKRLRNVSLYLVPVKTYMKKFAVELT